MSFSSTHGIGLWFLLMGKTCRGLAMRNLGSSFGNNPFVENPTVAVVLGLKLGHHGNLSGSRISPCSGMRYF